MGRRDRVGEVVDYGCQPFKFSAAQSRKVECCTPVALILQNVPSSPCARATSDDKNCPSSPVRFPALLVTLQGAVKMLNLGAKKQPPVFIMAQSQETRVTMSDIVRCDTSRSLVFEACNPHTITCSLGTPWFLCQFSIVTLYLHIDKPTDPKVSMVVLWCCWHWLIC